MWIRSKAASTSSRQNLQCAAISKIIIFRLLIDFSNPLLSQHQTYNTNDYYHPNNYNLFMTHHSHLRPCTHHHSGSARVCGCVHFAYCICLVTLLVERIIFIVVTSERQCGQSHLSSRLTSQRTVALPPCCSITFPHHAHTIHMYYTSIFAPQQSQYAARKSSHVCSSPHSEQICIPSCSIQ